MGPSDKQLVQAKMKKLSEKEIESQEDELDAIRVDEIGLVERLLAGQKTSIVSNHAGHTSASSVYHFIAHALILL